MTREQAMQAMEARKLGTDYVEGMGWTVRAGKTRVRSDPGATLEEAVDRAVAHLDEREAQRDERQARRVIDRMQRGDYYHVPRREQVTGEDGEREERLVFDIVPAAGGDPVVTGARHVLVAWAELAALGIGNGAATTPPERATR